MRPCKAGKWWFHPPRTSQWRGDEGRSRRKNTQLATWKPRPRGGKREKKKPTWVEIKRPRGEGKGKCPRGGRKKKKKKGTKGQTWFCSSNSAACERLRLMWSNFLASLVFKRVDLVGRENLVLIGKLFSGVSLAGRSWPGHDLWATTWSIGQVISLESDRSWRVGPTVWNFWQVGDVSLPEKKKNKKKIREKRFKENTK